MVLAAIIFREVLREEEEGTRFEVSRKGKEKRTDLAKAGNCAEAGKL